MNNPNYHLVFIPFVIMAVSGRHLRYDPTPMPKFTNVDTVYNEGMADWLAIVNGDRTTNKPGSDCFLQYFATPTGECPASPADCELVSTELISYNT